MMHSTCLNSAVSLRCRGSRSSSFNAAAYFSDARFESNPLLISSSFDCCCCCCCANNNSIYNRLPRINPSFLCNGLRQSTLIQFSPSKRLVFHGRRRQSCNSTSGFSSLTDSDRKYYYEKLHSFKDRTKQGGLGKGRYACWSFEDKRKEQSFSNGINDDYVDDVEILLSLLTEEVGLEYIDVRERKRINRKDPCYVSGKTKTVGSGAVKRDLKCDNKVVEVQSREEEDRRLRNERREEERGTFVKGANHERRKEGSSCSSYYSVSSTGEFESDNDVEIKHDGCFVRGESLSEYKDDRKRDSYGRSYDEEVEENVHRQQEFGKEQSEILKKDTAERHYGNQEWRKKSEKKLNVESTQHQSHVSVNTEQNSQQHSEKVDRITSQSQSRMNYKRLMETSETDNRVIESSSSTQKRYSDAEKKLNTSVQELTGIDRGETIDRVTRQGEYRRQSKVISEASGIHEIDTREASSSSSLEAGMKNWEDNSTEVSGQVDNGREEKHQRMDHLTTLKGSRVKSQQISGISATHITNTQNTTVSLRQSDVRREKLHSETSSSEEKVTMVQQVAQRRKNIEEKYSSSGVELEGTTEGYNIIDEGGPLTESMKTGRRTTKASSFHVGMPKEASSTYKALKLNPEPNLQESGARGAGKSGSHPIVLASAAQQVSGAQLHVELTHEHSFEHFETVTGELQEQAQESSRVQRSEIVGGDIGSDSPWEPLSFISQDDAIASADQQQKSSRRFVGEFVRMAKHELSTSEFQQEKKTHDAELVYKDAEQHELKRSDQDGSGDPHQKDGARGPSDEMWHVTGASIQQPSETDAPDNTSSTGNGESVKRSGRSFWNVIGDVVRLRWASPRSETHTPKPAGGRASSNQSISSEAWFSGHEPEESNDDNVKMKSTKGQSQSQKEVSNPSSSKEKAQHEGLDSPLLSSSNTNQGSSSKNMSPSVIEESSFPLPAIRMRRSPVVKKTSGIGETDASGSGKMDQPVPKLLTQISQTDASGSRKMVKTEQPVPNPLTEISPADASGRGKMVIVDQPDSAHVTETHSKDGELKRRKLARIDQVSKDRFDEWEEAYTLETKQRQNDELFMREALLEAKKAADFWEVPVGAVLVQDGKIIARGYNLVEELRDSTAHAEMICIREASNNLRSWRLSGTTLYVTLEPCPMCAGAILQARIDTVVWGAPNKLLGADGSWIRLFPDGDGGNGSDKPPAPVHPFHPNMTVRRGVLSSECADVMQQFFQLRRKKKEKKTEAEPPTPPPSSLPITQHHHSKFFSKMHDAFSIMFCL